MTEAAKPQQFQIFRAKDAPELMEAGCMTLEPYTPVQRAGVTAMLEAGLWFKKDYPLPLHSHNADCLYYIIAGTLRLGNEDLGPRDSFFVPSDVPYTYKVGPDGVELLEFRHATSFNFVNHAKGEAFWTKAIETVAANVADWKTAVPPTMVSA